MSAIGLVFITRPFSDITRIWDIYVNGVSEPYFHEFNSHHYYRLITALILAPVIEELIFRKYIFTSLLQRYSLRVAFLVSCILFSLMHMPQLTNLIPTFMLGAACCLVYIKTKRIIYPILLHFTYNLVINLFVWIGAPALNWIYTLSPFDYRYWAIVIMGGLLGFLALKRIPISKP
ncbi:CPBP family intramembrane glutamic endopeptidase [Saccharicrinis carchari]